MKITNILGIIITAVVIIGLFILTAKDYGYKVAIIEWAKSIFIAAILIFGIWLMLR